MRKDILELRNLKIQLGQVEVNSPESSWVAFGLAAKALDLVESVLVGDQSEKAQAIKLIKMALEKL